MFLRNGLRRKAAIELGTMCMGTIFYFLLSGLWRTTKVDMAFGAVGLVFVLWSARETRDRFWERPDKSYLVRLKESFLLSAAVSIPVLTLFAVMGAALALETSGQWTDVSTRILSPHLLKALPLYIVWAFVQQFLFQFYLMSRLRVLAPSAPYLLLALINGVFFSAVHITEWQVALPTFVSGVVWSLIYLKYRCLPPLAVSHALLGGTYFHWVLGRNVFAGLF